MSWSAIGSFIWGIIKKPIEWLAVYLKGRSDAKRDYDAKDSKQSIDGMRRAKSIRLRVREAYRKLKP